MSKEKIRVFISYSWEDNQHNKWVYALSDIIKDSGAEVIIDKEKLKYGNNMYYFMENSIRISDVVLLILTPTYKKKADSRKGGVGYEFNIITPLMMENLKTNEKFIGVIRKGDNLISVPINMHTNLHVDLRKGPNYKKNLNDLIKQIIKTPIKLIKLKTVHMDDNYKPLEDLLPVLKESVHIYFDKLFKEDKHNTSFEASLQTAKIKTSFNDWEEDIDEYHRVFLNKFSEEKFKKLYDNDPENFRTKVFKEVLWTVRAALRTNDPDLARYKRDFADADSEEIVNTVQTILHASKEYVANVAKNISYNNIIDASNLQMDFLNKDSMLMNKIIGFGIRSEILHRYFPENFPIMTQGRLWALYFMSQSSNEFINIETRTREGKTRVSHNWTYDYQRFTFIMMEMTKELEKVFSKFGCKFNSKYRFGYINEFLSEVDEYHRQDRKALHEWREGEKY